MRFATLMLSLALASTAVAQSVENEIRAEVARYVAAINTGNASTVAALYLNDPRTSSAGDGGIYWGWRGIAQAAREMGTIRMTADSVAVLQLSDDAAFAVLRMRWTLASTSEARTGAMTLVYTRTREGWRVAHDHTSTRSAPGTAPPTFADAGPSAPRRATTSCTITRIIDGDTIECARLGRVRLIGMDTPESNQRPFGAQASKALVVLLPVGSEVRLEPDVEARDRYRRLLAYVWAGDTMINWRMVREGWAVLLTYPPNVQYVDAFADAERRAREERRGLWATGGFDCRPADHRGNRCE
jgi:endonuclease YncB( thermonuclease family)